LARVWPYKDRVVSFIAIKDIKKGEELLLYYMVPIDHT
jgi:SET domain-containing protein